MNRTAIPVLNFLPIFLLIFLAAADSVQAQPPTPGAPPPVPLFSSETIRSFTPSDNAITDAKAKLGDMIFDEKRISADNSVRAIPVTRHDGLPLTLQPRGAWATGWEAQRTFDPERDVL